MYIIELHVLNDYGIPQITRFVGKDDSLRDHHMIETIIDCLEQFDGVDREEIPGMIADDDNWEFDANEDEVFRGKNFWVALDKYAEPVHYEAISDYDKIKITKERALEMLEGAFAWSLDVSDDCYNDLQYATGITEEELIELGFSDEELGDDDPDYDDEYYDKDDEEDEEDGD